MVHKILSRVSKPARYTGGEYNTPPMDKPNALSVCLCFPDIYEVGMSNIGLKILYHLLNEDDGIRCERCFAPWEDMAKELRQEKLPLFSLETKTPLNRFDIVGFSLQYELSFTSILFMLDLSDIPFYSKDRGESFPLIIGGGPSALNCEPVADFFDLFIIGDGEESFPKLCKLYGDCKRKKLSREDFLRLAAKSIDGVYVPKFVEVCYGENGEITELKSQYPVKKAVVKDLDKSYFPTKQLVPNIEIVHDRVVVELFRGCSRGCRFCQAGFTYRPIRIRKADTIVDTAEKLICNTGYDELSFNSLSTGDYDHLPELFEKVQRLKERYQVNFALPSLRADSVMSDFAEGARRSSLTFAPEAGTQRLRDVINKNITDTDIESCLTEAFKRGYSTVKLYFMMGLPTENDEDIDGISRIASLTKRLFKEHKATGKEFRLSLSVSTFIPKPFTPFQWEKMDSGEEVERKQKKLREILRQKNVHFSWNEYSASQLEGVFARGDRRLSKVVELAYRNGCVLDGWSELFFASKWDAAFLEAGIDKSRYTGEISETAVLPWDYLNAFIKKSYLLAERKKAYTGETTADCRKGCRNCGASVEGKCEIVGNGKRE